MTTGRIVPHPGSEPVETVERIRFAVEADGRRDWFIGLLAPGSVYTDGAIERVRQLVASDPAIDLVYGDSMLVDDDGSERVELRPGWSPDALLVGYDLGPALFAREAPIAGREVTGHHQLALMAGEEARAVAHLPDVLSIRFGPSYRDLDADAVRTALAARHARIAVDRGEGDGDLRLEPAGPALPFVSIVMLTGGATRTIDGADVVLVRNALASILLQTDRDDFEIVVVLDTKAARALGEQLAALDPERVVVVRDDQPFNFSAANNLGVEASRGEHIVFVNDDCEVVSGDWLTRLGMHLTNPGVGIVGARLLYGDGRVQHAGLVARDGWVEHRFGGYPNDHRSLPSPIEDVSAVTGACLAITRSLFDTIGGFPVEFPLNFNDVDLCFRAADAGRRVVLDHEIVLIHHETSSRDPGITDDEQAAFVARWPERSTADPFDHPEYVPVRAQPIPPPSALLRLRRTLGVPTAAARISR